MSMQVFAAGGGLTWHVVSALKVFVVASAPRQLMCSQQAGEEKQVPGSLCPVPLVLSVSVKPLSLSTREMFERLYTDVKVVLWVMFTF